jgi:uncharacterized protein YyaL (SSP411 family)
MTVVTLAFGAAAAPDAPPIAWQGWSQTAFQQAKAEHKFVLLDLGTQWCHWCHVMDDTTYKDPTVLKLLAEKYIALKVDADSRPDLSDRYEDYGWPATVVFAPGGSEIVKRRGYLAPDEMASMLQAIIKDPTPGPSIVAAQTPHYTDQTSLSDPIRQELLKRYSEAYDTKNGSWGHVQKYLDWDGVEWAMRQARHGNTAAEKMTAEHMARQTLDAQLNLLDPAWGGVYQYSTDGDWQHPHFEKIMQMQAENLRIYSLAWSQFHDPRYLAAAQSIHHFLINFLRSPDGAFYTSMDADLVDGVHSADYFALPDSARRAQGIPHVDDHQYSRENGWAIRALAALYESTGDITALDEATTAANWIITHRSRANADATQGDAPTNGDASRYSNGQTALGGFSHDARDSAGPYLGDTLAMGQAFLELHAATADRIWLTRAERAADFIAVNFIDPGTPGLRTASSHPDQAFIPGRELDESIAAVRWANLLSQYSGRPRDKSLAQTAMKYVSSPDITLSREVGVAGILLADNEINVAALHIVIVSPKSDATANTLYQAAMATPADYKRVEWYDPAEGPLPNSDVEYPKLPKPAAFVCTGTACSAPAFTAETLEKRLSAK